MTQLELRTILFGYKFTSHREETFLKYVYDGYTYKNGIKPIRKKKTRNDIRKEFHRLSLDKELAHTVISRLMKEKIWKF